MKTKERDLLERVVSGDDDGDFFISHRLYKDIETFLAQPEQNNIQYLLDQVSRLTAENAMLKEKWSTPKREPLSGKEITKGFIADEDAINAYSYWAGINYAEQQHGIGVGDDNQ